MSKARSKYWYQEWFDTPYYHLLYRDRDEAEARAFIDKLFDYLKVEPNCHVLDLACGRGRHAHYMHSKGVEVTGIDLAASNIEFARAPEKERLHFKQANMLEAFAEAEFDLVLNLFTSFAYFESREATVKAMKNAAQALKPGGRILIDFLNPQQVAQHLIAQEKKEIEGVQFEIARRIDAKFIYKDITVRDGGQEYKFQERVQNLNKEDFTALLKAAGLSLEALFGNYNLANFTSFQSERLILLASK